MPRHSAAEAMPMPEPQDQEEKEIQEALRTLKEEPPPIPASADTKDALAELRKIAEDKKEEQEIREAIRTMKEEPPDFAAQERKMMLDARDKATSERMRRHMGASVLRELPPEDVVMEGGWSADAARDLGPRKKAEPPPIPSAAKKPEAKKPWYKRLFGSKES